MLPGLSATRLGLFALAGVVLVACDDEVDSAELDRLLAEVRAAEEVAQAEHAEEDESVTWTLTVLGETGTEATVLSYADLTSLTPTEVHTRPPLAGAPEGDFAGPTLATILERVGGAAADATELTLVASDGFRATIALDDVRAFPIMLATMRDGARLPRELGGPLLAVFPLIDHPELLERYTESWWVYYVTHVVVGTEPLDIRVGDGVVGASELASLPTRAITETVGYRVGWPSEPVTIQGPTLASVLEAAGADTTEATGVRVMSIAPITRGPDRPTRVSLDDAASGEVILGIAYGDPPAPIPARLGGPVVLCFTGAAAGRMEDHDWLTFVDELVVELPEAE